MNRSFRTVASMFGCLVLAMTASAEELWEPFQYFVPGEPDPCEFLDQYSGYLEPVIAGDRLAAPVFRNDWDGGTYEFGFLIFQRDAEGAWAQLDFVVPAEYDPFNGVSFDFSGEHLIVCAPFGKNRNVFVYTLNASGSYEETFQISDPSTGYSAFGRSIAVHGSLIGIGDEYWPNEQDRGTVWMYRRNADGSWSSDSQVSGSSQGERIGSEFALFEDVLCVISNRESSSSTDIGRVYRRTGVGSWGYVSGFTETQLDLRTLEECERRGNVLQISGSDDSYQNQNHVAIIRPGIGIGTLHHILPEDAGFVYERPIGGSDSKVMVRREEPFEPFVGGSVFDVWSLDPVSPPVLTGEVTVVNVQSYGGYIYTGDSLIMDAGFVKVDDGEGSTCAANVLCEVGYLPPQPCPEDLSGDGVVGVDDLLMIIAAWGQCP